jgi:hypothetical protein
MKHITIEQLKSIYPNLHSEVAPKECADSISPELRGAISNVEKFEKHLKEMNKKPYLVTVETQVIVMATDEGDADRRGQYYAREEEPFVVSSKLLKSIDEVPHEWNHSLPYNDGTDRTINQILNHENQTKP